MEIEDIHWSLASLAGKSAVETAFLRIRECASGRKSDEDDALSANDDGQWWATVQCLERSCVIAPSQQQLYSFHWWCLVWVRQTTEQM